MRIRDQETELTAKPCYAKIRLDFQKPASYKPCAYFRVRCRSPINMRLSSDYTKLLPAIRQCKKLYIVTKKLILK